MAHIVAAIAFVNLLFVLPILALTLREPLLLLLMPPVIGAALVLPGLFDRY